MLPFKAISGFNRLVQTWNSLALPITVKLSLTFLLVAILPMSFVSYYNHQISIQSIEESEYYKLELIATSKANRLDQLIIDNENTIENLSNDSRIGNFLLAQREQRERLHSEIQTVLEKVASTHPNYDIVYLIDKYGICVASTDAALIGKNYSFRDYFQKAIAGEAYVSSILLGVTTKREGIFFSYPVYSPIGKVLGVAAIKITAADIWNVINSINGSNIASFLVEEQGIIISHSNREYLYKSIIPLSSEEQKKVTSEKRYGHKEIPSLNIPELSVILNAKKSGHTSYYSPIEKNHQIVGYAPLQNKSWIVGVSQPKELFMTPINVLFQQNITFVLGAGALAAILAIGLSRTISKPINILMTASRNLEQGNFIQHESNLYKKMLKISHTQDDIGQFVRVFMKMAEGMRVRHEKMELQVMELRIQIDENKKADQVAEITETKYFQDLQYKAKKLRNRAEVRDETSTDYFQQLQEKIKHHKARLQINR